MAHYFAAPEIERIGVRLVAETHRHLSDVRIEYLFRSEASRSAGRLVFGRARKVSGLNALLATPERRVDPEDSSEGLEFFVVECAHDIWGLLTPAQQVGLVDHELSHCWIDYNENDEIKLVLRPHEIEEFAGVISRNGLYMPDLSAFVRKIGSDTLSLWAQGIPDDQEMFPDFFGDPEEKDGEVVQGPWSTGTSG